MADQWDWAHVIPVMIASYHRGSAGSATGSGGAITVGGNGQLTGSGYIGSSRWFVSGPGGTATSDSVGIGTNFWIRPTKNSGAGNTVPTAGVWTAVSASGVVLGNAGSAGSLSMDVAFSRYSDGAVIENTGTFTVNNTI